MTETSSFNPVQLTFPDAEPLPVGGATSDCFRVRLYGKIHFLKRLKESLRSDPRYLSALQKEFETGYQLDHPHLVRYVARTDDGILMDYIDGMTLDEFVRQHPGYLKNHRNANRFLRQLLSVVGYLHNHQIVHLDLKPANIMMTRVGHDVKLIDLGYCYTDTYSDTMGRTDKYAAPEQKDGSSVDARTDIYAVGRILQTLPCASYYQAIIKRCTAQEPDKRFQSTEDILRRMRSVVLTRRIILVALILSAVILLAFLFLSRSQKSSVVIDSSQSMTPSDTATSPSSVENSETSVPETMNVPPVTQPESPSARQSGSPSAPQSGSPSFNTPVEYPASKAVSSSMAISKEEVERRIKAVVSPVFQRVMGSLSDSVWNRHTQKMYSDLSLPMLDQCGDAVRVLWNDLSRKYDIDEKDYYHIYSKVLNSMSNDLYDKMRKNAQSPM